MTRPTTETSAAATVSDLLRSSTERLREAGSESARLDSELLLSHVLGIGRATLLGGPEIQVAASRRAQFATLVERRSKGEPVAYIRGIKEFYGLVLGVDARALIPRPETEILVELGLATLTQALTSQARPADSAPLTVWDVGTGSGAIIIAMAVEARRRGFAGDVRLVATDASAAAIALATENAVTHGVADLIEFATADLTAWAAAGRVGLLLANLPYVPTPDLGHLPIAATFEPAEALDGGRDGLQLVVRLLGQLADVVEPNGTALLEMGADQGDRIAELAQRILPGRTCTIKADLGGQPRVVQLTRRAT